MSGRSGNCCRPRRVARSAVTCRPSSPKAWCSAGRPASIPAQEYSFRHILIQEAAYRAIPKSLRAELHHRFADWLEAGVKDPFPGRSEILGHHLERSVRYRNELGAADPQAAALAQRAAEHLETAGNAAHDRGDDVAAVNLLDRAAALLPGDDPALGRLYYKPRARHSSKPGG